VPLVEQLALGEAAVQDGDTAGEAFGEAAHGLRCERDLRHQNDGPLTARDSAVERRQVDLRLTGAGDTVEKEGLRAAGLHRSFDGFVGGALLFGQRRGRPKLVRAPGKGVALDGFVAYLDEARFGE